MDHHRPEEASVAGTPPALAGCSSPIGANPVARGAGTGHAAGMAGGLTVRRAERDDVDGAFALFAEVAEEGRWLGTEPGFDREARLAARHQRLDDPGHVSLVAVADGEPARRGIVGDLGATLAPHGVADLGMVVDRRWRGRGVGDALLAAAVDWARGAGAHKVALQVWPHNVAARGLYAKHGFVEEGVLRRHYRRRDGALWDAVVMGLVLDQVAPGGPSGDGRP